MNIFMRGWEGEKNLNCLVRIRPKPFLSLYSEMLINFKTPQ